LQLHRPGDYLCPVSIYFQRPIALERMTFLVFYSLFDATNRPSAESVFDEPIVRTRPPTWSPAIINGNDKIWKWTIPSELACAFVFRPRMWKILL
jgi:hypothetical protein